MIEWKENVERRGFVEADRYHKLIEEELTNLPDYVRAYYRGTNHSVTTTYQYLTEFRRFFTWLRINQICKATSNSMIETGTLANLRRDDVMLYIDYLPMREDSKIQRLQSIGQLMPCGHFLNF